MSKKINVKVIFCEVLLSVIFLMVTLVLFYLIMPVVNNYYQHKLIKEVYDSITEMDISSLSDDDRDELAEYENEYIYIYIADQNFNMIYSSLGTQRSVDINVKDKKDKFTNNVYIKDTKGVIMNHSTLRVRMKQDMGEYYIAIRNRGSRKDSRIMQIVLIDFTLMLFGSIIFNLILSSRFTREILGINKDILKNLEGDFSTRISEQGPFYEVNSLGKSINALVDQLQQSNGKINDNWKQALDNSVSKARMEKKQKEFIVNMTHQLKTPLAVISSQVEMLEYIKDDQKKNEYISSAKEEINKMSEIVGNLLDMSVETHDMEKMVIQKLNLKQTLQYMCIKYESIAKKKRINMEQFLEDGCYINADREYIEQAINNYVMNAIEHTQIGGFIRITLKKYSDHAKVSVFNEGKNINETDMDKIWKGYFTTTTSLETNSNNNAGLGLYIVQNIVLMHGGEYGVDNKTDGVEFWMTFPLIRNESEK